jgi:hypothetical protein
LWWTKWHWAKFSPSTSVSPANPHSTNCSITIIIILGWYNRPRPVPSGLSLTPPRETKNEQKKLPIIQILKIAERSIENVVKFKYLGITETNQNVIHVEITSKLNSGNTCYHSVAFLSALSKCKN